MKTATPWKAAQELVQGVRPKWSRITSGKINLRKELLSEICIDESLAPLRQLRSGLPGLYLISCAQHGDQVAYDLLAEIGIAPTFARPKRPGGVAVNAARDFVVSVLAKMLMMACPELSYGANSATQEGTSAVDLIRKALEEAGLGCIDYKASSEQAPVPRSMEQAVRRFQTNEKYRELCWSTTIGT